MTPTREAFLVAAQALEGVFYRWGGKQPRGGLDCSGLVTWCLKVVGGPDLRQSHNSDVLWAELPPVEVPVAGDLAFYGAKDDPSHVVICLGGQDEPIIGANGGGSKTTSYELATASRAEVKRKPDPRYRPDLLGYRSTRFWWTP
jgi:cell wall-associated NlpC family hydrolase